MDIGRKIKKILEMKNISQGELAKLTGRDRNYINALVNNPDANPELKTLEVIAQALGVPISYIMDFPLNGLEKEGPFGECPRYHAPSSEDTLRPIIIVADNLKGDFPPDLPQEQYVAVPMLKSTAGAGIAPIPSEEIEEYALIHTSQIGRKRNLIALRVDREADSMRPTIEPGDIVAIDKDDKWLEKVRKNAIYLTYIPGPGVEWGWALKRVTVVKDFLILNSDNREYETRFFPLSEFEHAESPLVGRVVWLWRSLEK